jgi:hypothetical protein
VIDQARVIPATVAVDARVVIQGEKKGVMAIHSVVVIPAIGLVVGYALTRVLYDSLTAANPATREDAASLNPRPSDLVDVPIVV